MNVFKFAVSVASICLCISIQGRADTQFQVTPQDDIQSIIDNCGDSESNKVTIYMSPGKYGKFSARSNIDKAERYISLIGHGDVTVESDSGYYSSPAAELRLHGIVQNIQFIASHPENVVEPNDKGAYAVHADYGSMHMVFNECKFISYQTAGVGMGMTYDSEVTFNNCRFENRGTQAFGTGWNLGALFVHSSEDYANVDGAKLNINKCTFYSPEGSMVIKEPNGNDIEVNVTEA